MTMRAVSLTALIFGLVALLGCESSETAGAAGFDLSLRGLAAGAVSVEIDVYETTAMESPTCGTICAGESLPAYRSTFPVGSPYVLTDIREGNYLVAARVCGAEGLLQYACKPEPVSIASRQESGISLTLENPGDCQSACTARAEIAEFTATTPDVRGGESILSWRTSRAREVVIVAGGAPVYWTESAVSSGSFSVYPDSTTTYELIAHGDGGDAKSTLEVRVLDSPVIDRFEADPPAVVVGGVVHLEWETRGAETISLRKGFGNILLDNIPVAMDPGFFKTVVTSAAPVFWLTVTSGAESREERIEVETGELPSAGLSVAPRIFDDQSTIRLMWTTRGADYVELCQNGECEVQPASSGSGSFMRSVTASSVFTLTASNRFGVRTVDDYALDRSGTTTDSDVVGAARVMGTLPASGFRDLLLLRVRRGDVIMAGLEMCPSSAPVALILIDPNGAIVAASPCASAGSISATNASFDDATFRLRLQAIGERASVDYIVRVSY